MNRYKALFFDVDDTLLDFRAAERAALQMLFAAQGLPLTEQAEREYKRINGELWQAFEAGKMSRDQVVNTRFARLLPGADGVLLEREYRSFLETGHQLMPGALELIQDLHQQQYDLYIVTNGVSKTQDIRLRNSGLLPYFKGVFVSEDTGYQKPMPEFFAHVFARMDGFSAEQGLIIGDSLSADIQGGAWAGLDTCWFNPLGKQNGSGIVPTFEIDRLDALKGCLGT
ncbi:2-haloacid dehalogenase [Tumebacillus sp. BK434]|uniref:YjjG family noncanonical pyrimidine nucleotidase n=1 Tax=Tumebacillus sp. BK434 TaxID=2512169 RepID=UPI001049484D|nr:YjjG family noncanonical pyrimidine nucleotidase [Tumebacillus sp. BK434]TCP57911.1 2-haloacid dehalogenase [Tumebacillus sp. BK434]